MRRTIYIEHYEFNPPAQITKKEYEYYKQVIKSNPNAKLNATISKPILKKVKKISSIVGYAALGFLDPPSAYEGISNRINKSKAEKEEDRFWETIKLYVEITDSFEEFADKVRDRFSYYR